MLRLAFALMLFPLAAFGVMALCSRVFADSAQVIQFNEIAGVGPLGIFAALLLLCAVAVPALLVAAPLNRLSLTVAIAIGAVAGFLSIGTSALRQLLAPRLHVQFVLEQVLDTYPFVFIGITVCIAFWFVAAWHNPWVAKVRVGAPRGVSNVA